ncbi:MAG: hypothetical protein ACI8ZF_000498 [Candidatus Midichloriaceae bacterium]|jgi:hypothetical protein
MSYNQSLNKNLLFWKEEDLLDLKDKYGAGIIDTFIENDVYPLKELGSSSFENLIITHGVDIIDTLREYDVFPPKELDPSAFGDLITEHGLSFIDTLRKYNVSLTKELYSYAFKELIEKHGVSFIDTLREYDVSLPKELDSYAFEALIKKNGVSFIDTLREYDISPPKELNSYAFKELIEKHGVSFIDTLRKYNVSLPKELNSYAFRDLITKHGVSFIDTLRQYGVSPPKELDSSDFKELIKKNGVSFIDTLREYDVSLPKELDPYSFGDLITEHGLSFIDTLRNYDISPPKELNSYAFKELITEHGVSFIDTLRKYNVSLPKELSSSDFKELIKKNGVSFIDTLREYDVSLPKELDPYSFGDLITKHGVSFIDTLRQYGVSPPKELNYYSFKELIEKHGVSFIDTLRKYDFSLPKELDPYSFKSLIDKHGVDIIDTLREYDVSLPKLDWDIIKMFGLNILKYYDIESGFFSKDFSTIVKIIEKIGVDTIPSLLNDFIEKEDCLDKLTDVEYLKLSIINKHSIDTITLLANKQCFSNLSAKKIGNILNKTDGIAIKAVLSNNNNLEQLEKTLYYAKKFHLNFKNIIDIQSYIKFLESYKGIDHKKQNTEKAIHEKDAEDIYQKHGTFTPSDVFVTKGNLLIKPMNYIDGNEYNEIVQSNFEFLKDDGALFLNEGYLYNKDCNLFNSNIDAIYVMDSEANIFVSDDGHHSYILNTNGFGSPTSAAGEINIVNGKITYIDGSSGHYTPTDNQLILAFTYLDKENAFDKDVHIKYENSSSYHTIEELRGINVEEILKGFTEVEE